MCGNNDKDQQAVENMRTQSAGLCCGFMNCGIAYDIGELLGKESCSQVLFPLMYLRCRSSHKCQGLATVA